MSAMSENRRIFWNIVATYGRSLLALLCGLFSSRWALRSLGVVDYGLYGVVGGLTVFITLLNNTLACATGRFYAISIGKARLSADLKFSLEEVRRWFNPALAIHIVVPCILMAIGYPLGVWAIYNFLNIPPERVSDCIWVFRFTCLSCFLSMMNVPFVAMYSAKQYIAELTIYSYATTVLNFIFLYYMVSHPRVWLFGYSAWCCAVACVPQILLCIRGYMIFTECRIKFSYMVDASRLRQLASFAIWNFLGILCAVLRSNGIAILINKKFGAVVNSANALATSTDGHVSALSSSLARAFNPAIVSAYGEGDMTKMSDLAFRSCKFGCLLMSLFMLPLIVEIDYVLKLWLCDPPCYTAYLCIVVMLSHFIDISTQGHKIAVQASGQIKKYQLNMTVISILTLPAAIVLVLLGGGVVALGAVLIINSVLVSIRRVYYGGTLAKLSGKQWMKDIVLPLLIVAGIAVLIPFVVTQWIEQSFVRLCFNTILCETILVGLSWRLLLSTNERKFVKERIHAYFQFNKV